MKTTTKKINDINKSAFKISDSHTHKKRMYVSEKQHIYKNNKKKNIQNKHSE